MSAAKMAAERWSGAGSGWAGVWPDRTAAQPVVGRADHGRVGGMIDRRGEHGPRRQAGRGQATDAAVEAVARRRIAAWSGVPIGAVGMMIMKRGPGASMVVMIARCREVAHRGRA